MPAQNIASAFESLIFRVSVDDDIVLELRMEYLSHKGAVLRIISPHEFAGNTVDFPNVPNFAMPGLFGYHYHRWLTPKFTDYLVKRSREWYWQQRAVKRRIEEIRQFQAVGLSDYDITGWIKAETGVFFPYGRLAEILQGLPE